MEATIRTAIRGDLPAISAIYNHYVLTSTCTYQLEPETEADRETWFAERSELHPAIVAEFAGEVVGWASLSPWKSRAGYRHSVEASVYIRHDSHRRGLGRRLMIELIALAKAAGHHTIVGGTCSSQEASLALQLSLGFVRVAHLKEVGFKFGRWLDVIYTQLMLDDRAES